MMQPIVFILLDAFRWDYLQPETAPTLWKLKDQGVYAQKLRPSFGFCEITESATGARPTVSGKFTQLTFTRTQQGSIAQTYLKGLEKVTTWVKNYGGRGSTRMTRWFTKDCLKPLLSDPKMVDLSYNIPMPLLPLLTAVEAQRYTDPNAFGIESCFDIFAQSNRTVFDDTYVINSKVSGPDQERVAQLISHANDPFDLFMIYLGGCDEFGHNNGPLSPELFQAVAQQDAWIAQMIAAFPPSTNFVIVGDHGMLPVTDTIDITMAVDTAMGQFKHARDYILFLDSTLARVWWHNDKAGDLLKNLFDQPVFKNKGKVIDASEANDLGIPAPGDRYGQLIWRANPGVMIFPDYFNTQVPVGMHGYPTHIDEQKGMCILWGKDVPTGAVDEVELIDICPTLCELAGLPSPKMNQGTSLLRQIG